MPRMFGKQNKTDTEERFGRLQELEHMLAALDGSHAIIEFDLDGTIITANDNFLSAMGYTLTEIQGQHHRIFVAPDARATPEYKQFWSSLASGEYYTDQVSRIDKSGRQIWLQASYCPVFDASGEVVKVMKFATDITEQRLRESDTEGQLKAIRRAQAVIEFDIQGKVITANSNFLDAVGYSLEEIVGKHHSLFVHPEESSTPEYQRLWQKLRDGIFVSDRCRRVTKQGEIVWLQASYNPILDPQGQPVKVVKFALDITEQKQAEENLKSLISEVSDVMSGMQEGNLTLSMQGNYNPELMVLVDSINRTIRQLGSLVGRVSTNAQTIKNATTELNTQYSESRQAAHKSTDQTLQVAAAAKQIFTNISKVTAAMSQMTSSVEQVSSNSSEAANVAQRAVGLADSAKINVNQLADSSNDIGAVIKVINSIADQTNLLALNATIEAARAGDAGKGFAVVANEVKELAKETAKATEEVAIKISTIQNDSQVAVKAINDIGSTIENISKTQSSIASNVDAQSSVSDEINHAFHDVAEGSKDIELTISEATVAVSENQSRADHSQVTTSQLGDLAEELVELVSRFKTAS